MIHGSPNIQKKGTLWRNRDFLLLWGGQIVSTLGSSISAFALPLLVLFLTHSPVQAGLVAAVRELPYLLFSLPAGALLDRWNRKTVMIFCDLLRWIALGTVPLAFLLGNLVLSHLYAVAFIDGVAYLFFSLAQISALPCVVGTKQLEQAYALDQTVEYAGPLIGPILGALLIGFAATQLLGMIFAFLVDSISYVVSCLSLLCIAASFQVAREHLPQHNIWREIMQGLRFLWQKPELRLLMLLTTAINLLQSPIDLALVVLGQNVLHLDVQELGMILGAGGVGGLFGSIVAPWLTGRLRKKHIIALSLAIWTLAACILTFAPSVLLLIVGRFLISCIWPTYGVMVVSHRLLLTPDELRGRVNSAFRFLSFGCEPLGKALGGLLLASLGARHLLGLLATGFALLVLGIIRTRNL